MRHIYTLSNESRKVMSGHVARIAEEADVSDSYIYGILSGDKTDPFSMFQHLYSASARAGAPVCHWDNKLDAIRSRYEKQLPLKTEIECLTAKINANADTSSQMVDALKDGVIDNAEAEKLQRAVDK